MLIIPPPKPRKPRRPLGPGATGLQVLSATYVWGSSLTLVFNGAINIAGIVASDFLVNDPVVEGALYAGHLTPVLLTPNTVRMLLAYVDDSVGEAITLSVGSGNGITTVDGTQSFAGVNNVAVISVSP